MAKVGKKSEESLKKILADRAEREKKKKTKLAILAGGKGQPPMAKERVLDTMKSKAQAMGGDIKSMAEMNAATKGLKTLTSEGPGRLKVPLRSGGRAGYKDGSKGCKLAMKGKGKAYGKNS
jgi:hypothetical protein